MTFPGAFGVNWDLLSQRRPHHPLVNLSVSVDCAGSQHEGGPGAM